MCKIDEDSTTTVENTTGITKTRRKSRTLTDLVTNRETRKVRRHSEVTRPQAQNLLTHITHTIFVHNKNTNNNNTNNNNTNNNNNNNKERIHGYKSFTILVLGATEVGKTSIIQRFVSGKFTTEYLPTISEEYETGIFLEIGDKLKQFDLVFKDFSGDFNVSHPELYREEIQRADGFILVHSKESSHSFAQVLERVADIQNATQRPHPAILVIENKCDVQTCFDSLAKKSFEMEGLLNESVSAKSNMKIEEAIAKLIKQIECITQHT